MVETHRVRATVFSYEGKAGYYDVPSSLLLRDFAKSANEGPILILRFTEEGVLFVTNGSFKQAVMMASQFIVGEAERCADLDADLSADGTVTDYGPLPPE
jgi:hypothetical protein